MNSSDPRFSIFSMYVGFMLAFNLIVNLLVLFGGVHH